MEVSSTWRHAHDKFYQAPPLFLCNVEKIGEAGDEAMKASPPRRRHGSENRPRSTVWQRQFTISLTNWSLNKSTMRTFPPCRCSKYRLVLCSFSQSAGYCRCDYLRKHACYVNGHTHADWIDCSTKVFFTKSPFFANSRKFSPSKSFPLYGSLWIPKQVHVYEHW